MPATVERQRVMIPHVRSWLAWRAVCWAHPREKDEVVAPWMAADTQDVWILARIDAVLHDLQEHQSATPVPSVFDLFSER